MYEKVEKHPIKITLKDGKIMDVKINLNLKIIIIFKFSSKINFYYFT